MTSARYLVHVTLPDDCDWVKSAANFPLLIDQTLLLPLTVPNTWAADVLYRCISGSVRPRLMIRSTFFRFQRLPITVELIKYSNK